MTPRTESAIVLRTAAVWGTTVLAVRQLDSGQSLLVGDQQGSLLPRPDGTAITEMPIRAVGSGWELDARGVTGGVLLLRGRREDPVQLAQSGAPIPIVAGDHGLLQYENLSLFFQFSTEPPKLPRRRRPDLGLLLSFLFALIAVGGGLGLIWAITTPLGIPKPLELTSNEELAQTFNLDLEQLEPLPSDSGDKGVEDPGTKDKKEQGGQKPAPGPQGALGRRAPAEKAEQPGDPGPALGGMAEALSGDVGEEVRRTLETISSVADALGGLRSDRIVLGQGSGLGLKGSGSGGGGDSEGVPFGAGTLETGFGAGKGGGYGTGRGGVGGPGTGGTGRGGGKDGTGAGGGERQVAGGGAAKPGQGLSPNQIARVVNSRMGAFRACYEAAQARDPTMRGSVSIAWTISPSGSVSSASVANSSLGNARVEGCLLRQFRRLKFPSADKPTGANWPFVFRPSKK